MLPIPKTESALHTSRPGPYVIAEIGVNHEGRSIRRVAS